jgi:hypothetical protein
MSKYLLLGSGSDIGFHFLRMAARSNLQIKCLHRDNLGKGRVNLHPLAVKALGGIPIPIRVPFDAESGPRILQPILEDLDGVVYFSIEDRLRPREPEFVTIENTVVSMMQKSANLRRLLIWTSIPSTAGKRYPSGEQKAFLKGIQTMEGLDWTTVRSGFWLDALAGKNDEKGENRIRRVMKATPPGGIELGAKYRDSIWKEDMCKIMLEVLKTDGLTGRTLDVKSVKPTKDNTVEKVIAELAASPKEKLEPKKNV